MGYFMEIYLILKIGFPLKFQGKLRILTMFYKIERRIRINHNFYRFLLSSISIFKNKMKK